MGLGKISRVRESVLRDAPKKKQLLVELLLDPARGSNSNLVGVSDEFANECDIQRDGERDLIDSRGDEKLSRELSGFAREVLRNACCAIFNALLNDRHLVGFRLNRNGHAGANKERTAVDFFAIHKDVAMADELLRSKDAGSEFEPVNDVVEAALEALDEDRRCIPLGTHCFFVVANELSVGEHSVDRFEFLLLFQLNAVVRFLFSFCSVHSRWIWLVQKGIARFTEDVRSKSTCDAILGACVSNHCIS